MITALVRERGNIRSLPEVCSWLDSLDFDEVRAHESLACELATIANNHMDKAERKIKEKRLKELGMIDAQLIQLKLL